MAAGKDKDLTAVSSSSPVLRAAKSTVGVIIVLAIALAFWYASTPILLAFAGVLLAIVLYGASRWLAERTGFSRLPLLGAVALLTIVVIGVAAWQAGPVLATQVTELTRSAAVGLANLSKQAVDVADQERLLQNVNLVELLSRLSPWNIATGATAVAVSLLGGLTAGLIVLFIGIYLAADPDTYVKLAARLAPEPRRQLTYEMMSETGDVLRRWLLGQSVAMAAIGSITYIGLLILGVPIAFVLALFAGLAGFLPYLGPIIGAIPIILVAGGESLTLAIYAIGLYVIVQFVESYLLTPLIQSRAVSLPPAIVIVNQLVLGSIFGILGIALATPLAAAATVPLRHIFGESGAPEPKGKSNT